MIRTRDLLYLPEQQGGGYSCWPSTEVASHPKDWVPHHLPGANPFLHNATERYAVPVVATPGGPETTYPEFRAKLKDASVPREAFEPAPPRAWNGDQPPASFDNVQIKVLHVQGGVYMLVGAGANTTIQASDEGVVVVDTQFAPLSEKLLTAIRQITLKPIRYVVNTNFHADHTGGNDEISRAGISVTGNTTNLDGAAMLNEENQAPIFAHEAVAEALKSKNMGARPTEPYLGDRFATIFERRRNSKSFSRAGRVYQWQSSIVFFRKSDVISTGDVFSTETYPVIDPEHGGSIKRNHRGAGGTTYWNWQFPKTNRKAAPTSFRVTGGFAIRQTWSSTAIWSSSFATAFGTWRAKD